MYGWMKGRRLDGWGGFSIVLPLRGAGFFWEIIGVLLPENYFGLILSEESIVRTVVEEKDGWYAEECTSFHVTVDAEDVSRSGFIEVVGDCEVDRSWGGNERWGKKVEVCVLPVTEISKLYFIFANPFFRLNERGGRIDERKLFVGKVLCVNNRKKLVFLTDLVLQQPVLKAREDWHKVLVKW